MKTTDEFNLDTGMWKNAPILTLDEVFKMYDKTEIGAIYQPIDKSGNPIKVKKNKK